MQVLGRPELLAQAAVHGDCVAQVERWCAIVEAATWQNLLDIRKTFSSADGVGSQVIFNIKGNKYRLIVSINYKLGIIVFETLLTHAEYDKGNWKR